MSQIRIILTNNIQKVTVHRNKQNQGCALKLRTFSHFGSNNTRIELVLLLAPQLWRR